MGKIIRLEVDNFKSYKGFQVIGPFKDFTAIIGPNGAGKSNLMDAISFVVGVRTKHLRSDNLKDLIYNADGQADSETRRARVTLVYQPSDSEIEDLAENQELTFTRNISSQGVSSYRLQGKNVTWDEYNRRLKDIGVLVKARNFLVFQGDVESIASKSPQELTKFFEEISGSVELSSEYEKLKSDKDEAETDTIFTFRQKKGISLEKKQVREQKEEADRFNRKKAALYKKKQEFFLFQLYHIEHDIEQTGESVIKVESKLSEIAQKEVTIETQLDSKKAEAAKAHQQESKLLRKLKAKRAAYSKEEPTAIKANESIEHTKKKLRRGEKALEEARSSCEKAEAEKEGLERDLELLKVSYLRKKKEISQE